MVDQQDISITLPNGRDIRATLFQPNKEDCIGAVMIGPATGIKRRFYAPFAEYLAENHYGVVTYDNQGIGDSLVEPIRKSKVTLQDWGYDDMPTVLEELELRFPDTHYHLLGHSAGGQLIGLMHNWEKLTSVFNVACSSGRVKNMNFPFVLQANFLMRIFMPLSNALFGFSQTQWLGLGEPLPKAVGKQWSQWCLGKGYVKTAFGKTVHRHWFDGVDLPSQWINAKDDDIAIDANVQDMLEVFPKMSAQRLTLNPPDHGLKAIGHMKFFSRKSKVLWPLALEWLGTFSEGKK